MLADVICDDGQHRFTAIGPKHVPPREIDLAAVVERTAVRKALASVPRERNEIAALSALRINDPQPFAALEVQPRTAGCGYQLLHGHPPSELATPAIARLWIHGTLTASSRNHTTTYGICHVLDCGHSLEFLGENTRAIHRLDRVRPRFTDARANGNALIVLAPPLDRALRVMIVFDHNFRPGNMSPLLFRVPE